MLDPKVPKRRLLSLKLPEPALEELRKVPLDAGARGQGEDECRRSYIVLQRKHGHNILQHLGRQDRTTSWSLQGQLHCCPSTAAVTVTYVGRATPSMFSRYTRTISLAQRGLQHIPWTSPIARSEILDPHISAVVEVVAGQPMEPSRHVQHASKATRVAVATGAFQPPIVDRSLRGSEYDVALPSGHMPQSRVVWERSAPKLHSRSAKTVHGASTDPRAGHPRGRSASSHTARSMVRAVLLGTRTAFARALFP